MCENENGQCRKIRFFGYRKSEEAFSVVKSKSSRIDKTVWVGLDRWAVMEELLSSGDQFTLKPSYAFAMVAVIKSGGNHC
jgi:hypothetical protein